MNAISWYDAIILFFQLLIALFALYVYNYIKSNANTDAMIGAKLNNLDALKEIENALEKIKGNIQEQTLLNLEKFSQDNRVKMYYIQTYLDNKMEIYHKILPIIDSVITKINKGSVEVNDLFVMLNGIMNIYENQRLYLCEGVARNILLIRSCKDNYINKQCNDDDNGIISEIKTYTGNIIIAIKNDMQECKYNIFVDTQ